MMFTQVARFRGSDVVIIGNGPSAAFVDSEWLYSLPVETSTVSCNAAYRKFRTDWLFALDTQMLREILREGRHRFQHVVGRPQAIQEILMCGDALPHDLKDGINFFTTSRVRAGFNTGTIAAWLVLQCDPDRLFLVGFDGSADIGNVFQGQPRYHAQPSRSLYLDWEHQFCREVRALESSLGPLRTRIYRVGAGDVHPLDEIAQRLTREQLDAALLEKSPCR